MSQHSKKDTFVIALYKNLNTYQNAPTFDLYISTAQESILALEFASEVMQVYCDDILSNNLSVLEALFLKRLE